MTWLLRPSLLLFLSVALAAAAAVLITWTPAAETHPEPQPVRAGDREIAFLYQATAGSSWERFVSAAERLAEERKLTLEKANAFPPQTTAMPEFALPLGSDEDRLVFRWYKVTSTQKVGDWVDALLKRSPPPLAFIGGSTSDAAWELARELVRATDQLNLPPERRPLLLLTTATAEQVDSRSEASTAPVGPDELPGKPLTEVYAGRTFRFCFTNRQMADAVVEFLWGQDDLRPDPNPVYKVYWEDDSYSKDLTRHFEWALHRRSAQIVVGEWACAAGAAANAAIPWHFPRAAQFPADVLVPAEKIDTSVGTFARPNRMEWDAASWLTQDFRKQEAHGSQPRPLLFLAGQTKPSRRFLRALEQNDRAAARRFIVASGDALAFNTVYRDRDVAWPIQDLPYNLVLFCHRNPVDAAAGFRPDRRAESGGAPAATTGTEDLLLFEDILAALMEAAGLAAATASSVGERLRTVQLGDQFLFDPDGNRRAGTGEHIVWLRPSFDGERVLPTATLTVWAWRGGAVGGRWEPATPPLPVNYEGSPRAPGDGHAGN